MSKSDEWKNTLKACPIDWLLEENNPAVRYLALRDLAEGGPQEVAEARRRAHREGPIAAILEAMHPEGWWVHPGNVYAPKCQGTSWSLLALSQMGASADEDQRVAKAGAYLMDYSLAGGGQFSSGGDAARTFSCFQGNMLTALMDLGCRDERLMAAYEWTARTVSGFDLPASVTPDGWPQVNTSGRLSPLKYVIGPLFACHRMPHCAWGGAKILQAFSRLPVEQRSPLVRQAIQNSVDYFLSDDPASANFPGETAGRPDPRWWNFHFPVIGMDLLQVAEALVGLGYGRDPRLANLLALAGSKQDELGRFKLEKNYGYQHKWWVKFGALNRPDKWVSLRAWRVLKKAAV